MRSVATDSQMPHNEDEVKKVKLLFDAAEVCMKKDEGNHSEVHIPVINELRYAGKHLLQALSTNNHLSAQKEYDRAAAHCMRAHCDAADATIISYGTSFRNFQEQYKNEPISLVWPQYLDACKKMDEAFDTSSAIIRRDDIDSPEDNRNKYFAIMDKLGDDSREIYRELWRVRDELNKQIAKDNHALQEAKNIGIRNTWIGVVVSALITIIVSAFFYWLTLA